jgi:D-3-phosphoglycerate dehydrogenase / 2-oxoglutarate reductase
MKILFLAPIDFNKKIKKKLKDKYDVSFFYGIDKNKLIKIISKYDILITNPGSNYKYDNKILNFAEKLKLIITPSTGTDHIDCAYCIKNNIHIRCLLNNRRILNSISASAEFTLFLIFLTLRKFNKVQKIIKNGSWRKKEDIIRGNEIQNKTVGIVGFGRIGKKLYKYLRSFGCTVKIYDPYINIKNKKLNFVKSLKTIFEKCDIISLNLSLNEKTENIISNKYLNVLKKNQILVNTSRGKIVDQKVIIKKIKQRKFFYSTDVISNEFKNNLKSDDILNLSYKNENLIVTPHIAGLTEESQTKSLNFILKELILYKKNISSK